MPIDSQRDEAGILTIHDVSGAISPGDVEETLRRFYLAPTPLVLWILGPGTLHAFSTERLREIIRLAIVLNGDGRRGGRTALVAEGDLEFGMSRMNASIAEGERTPIEVRAFREKAAALSWLLGSHGTGGDPGGVLP